MTSSRFRIMKNTDDKEMMFTRDVVLALLKTAARDNIAAAPSQVEAVGAVFRELMTRIDFDKQTVKMPEYDVGEIGQGAIGLAALAIKFGSFLYAHGIELTDESYCQRSDH